MPNPPEQKKDIFDLTEEEFYNFFNEEISPNIKIKKDKKNKKSHYVVIIILILFLIISSPFLIMAIKSSFPAFHTWSQESFLVIFGMIFKTCLIIIGFIAMILGTIAVSEAIVTPSQQDIKNEILPKLGLETEETVYKQSGDTIYQAMQRFNSLPSLFTAKKSYLDEILQGNYKGVPFIIAEYGLGIGPRSLAVIVNTKINKSFQNDLRVFSINGLNEILNADVIKLNSVLFSEESKYSVNLEDISFTQEYEVYGKDQVEARYLLTPTFIERLLKYKKAKKCDIDVFFTKYTFLPGNLFFCIYNSKNMFELPEESLENIVKNPKYFYKIISEIKDIMQIADALKLDQDIGM